MKKIFSALLPISIALFSCKYNSNIQGRGTDYLQGMWKQKEVIYQDKLLVYTLHTFSFTCDSFYLTLDTHAKVNVYSDSCFKNGYWTEYVKGTYSTNKDTLYLNGTFTKSNFKQKISGCYRIGQYLSAFVIKEYDNDSLYLQSVFQHLPISLHLQKKIICLPTPI